MTSQDHLNPGARKKIDDLRFRQTRYFGLTADSLVRVDDRVRNVLQLLQTLTPLDRWKTLQALSRLFSEARLESVTVEPADFQGENDRRPRFVRLVTRDVDLFGLDLDRLAMQAHEAVLDPVGLMSGKLVMIAPTPVKIEARVLEKDLDLAASTYTIRLRPGVFSLSGVDRFLFLKTRYELKAELRVNDANQLELDPRGLKYGIVPIPRPLVERVLASVNPLFDMDKFLGGLKTWVELKLVQPRLENEVMFARIQGAINPVASGSGSGVEGQGGRPLPGSTSPDSQPGPPPTRTGTQPAEHDQRPLTRAWSQ